VTYVDEEARQKALKRLEDEISVSVREQESQINSKIAEIKIRRDRTLAELRQRQEEIERAYEERIAEQLDPVIKEGQRLERLLQEQIGQVAGKTIAFEASGEVIIQAGEKISPAHLSRVQQVVRSHLEGLENQLREHKERELEEIKMEIARVRAEAEEQMEALRRQLEDQNFASQNQNARLRDELLELRPLTFLSESRYRELKQRWGQVFRADMGAEAIYDILRRLDLDKLDEELWH
jgi:DNA-directed RNA polymerase subunit beta'